MNQFIRKILIMSVNQKERYRKQIITHNMFCELIDLHTKNQHRYGKIGETTVKN